MSAVLFGLYSSRELPYLSIGDIKLEIVDGGGKTLWGDVSAVGTVLEGLTFDVVLDNNGKDLDAVRFVLLMEIH
ncbi:hypothetical protein L2E82_34576 [Cichorium intybus]|uniref:Uncharacterized protein n=1 Tax=Cichorium intybus TaxID=13427 RepID=A0ACB9BMB9_CICIN|nr:hypothetical protein L2E82_34576 [Cichorium intybus]